MCALCKDLYAEQGNDVLDFVAEPRNIQGGRRQGAVTARLVGIFQQITCAADRKALSIQQLADTPNQHHLMVLIIAPVAATLDWIKLGKFLLPIAQHMRLDPAQLADFTDGEITFGGDSREF